MQAKNSYEKRENRQETHFGVQNPLRHENFEKLSFCLQGNSQGENAGAIVLFEKKFLYSGVQRVQ